MKGDTQRWGKVEEPLLDKNGRPHLTTLRAENTDKTEAVTEGTVTQRTAPDGGWGWCVVLAGTVCMMVLATQGPCFGVLYGRRLEELGASPSLATWLFNIQSLIWNLTGPWAGPLREVFTYRTIATAGSLLAVSSLFFSAIVQNPYLLLLTFSTLIGVGGGLTIMSCYHMTASYFDKRLGLANGIVVTGGSLGLILLPQLASFLQEHYPFQWASLLTGAVILHAPVMTLLLHPVSWHRRALEQPLKDTVGSPSADKDAIEEQESLGQGLLRGSSVPADLLKLGGALSLEARKPRFRSGSECHAENQWLEQRGSAFRLGGSTFMGGSVLTLQNEDMQEKQQDTEKHQGPLRRVWIKFRSQYNVRLMKDPLAMGIALTTCLTIAGAINIFVGIKQ